MKVKELRKLKSAELLKTIAFSREETRALRFKVANNQLKNVRALRQAKQNIARALTIVAEAAQISIQDNK